MLFIHLDCLYIYLKFSAQQVKRLNYHLYLYQCHQDYLDHLFLGLVDCHQLALFVVQVFLPLLFLQVFLPLFSLLQVFLPLFSLLQVLLCQVFCFKIISYFMAFKLVKNNFGFHLENFDIFNQYSKN